MVEPTEDGKVQITFDNGGSVTVTGEADIVAERIGDALTALSGAGILEE
jgi:hypothetical protein